MKRFILAAALALIAAPPALAQVLSADQVTGQPGAVQGTASDGKRVELPVYVPVRPDGSTIDPSSGPTGASANQVQGNTAAASTDAGNPVKIGGVYSSALPTYTNGQRSNLQTDANGRLIVSPGSAYYTRNSPGDGISAANVISMYDGTAYSPQLSAGMVFNGAGWDRQRGSTLGTDVIPRGAATWSSGVLGVGATAAQVTTARTGRVSFTISLGTATNCAFGPTNSVTLGNSFRLAPTIGASITFHHQGAIWAICDATSTLYLAEEY